MKKMKWTGTLCVVVLLAGGVFAGQAFATATPFLDEFTDGSINLANDGVGYWSWSTGTVTETGGIMDMNVAIGQIGRVQYEDQDLTTGDKVSIKVQPLGSANQYRKTGFSAGRGWGNQEGDAPTAAMPCVEIVSRPFSAMIYVASALDANVQHSLGSVREGQWSYFEIELTSDGAIASVYDQNAALLSSYTYSGYSINGGAGWGSFLSRASVRGQNQSSDWDDFRVNLAVPEPATLALLGIGGLLGLARRRRRRA